MPLEPSFCFDVTLCFGTELLYPSRQVFSPPSCAGPISTLFFRDVRFQTATHHPCSIKSLENSSCNSTTDSVTVTTSHMKPTKLPRFQCPHCPKRCYNTSGLTQHINSHHLRDTRFRSPSPPILANDGGAISNWADTLYNFRMDTANNTLDLDTDNPRRPGVVIEHSRINGIFIKSSILVLGWTLILCVVGIPCDAHGATLPPNTPPPPRSMRAPNDWFPYKDRIQFETADLLFRETEMPRHKINHLLELWAASIFQATEGQSTSAPYTQYLDLFKIIDATPLGDVPWRCFTVTYNGPLSNGAPPSWMTQKYEVWFRCPRQVVHSMLANPKFKDSFDTSPYREYTPDGKRKFTNMFSAN